MCPDNDTPDTGNAQQNPTLAEDDKFRRTVVPAEGPNVDGLMNQIVDTHTRPDVEAAVKSDVEPSMPAPDAVPMPSPSAVREE
jgi:hypothetical protein